MQRTRQLGTCFLSLLQHALPIDAPNHPELLGNCWRSKFGPSCLGLAISLHCTENKFKTEASNSLRFSYSWRHRLILCCTWRKRKYIEIKDDSKVKQQKNLDRHGPRPIPNVCHLPDPPWYSVQTTFKSKLRTFCDNSQGKQRPLCKLQEGICLTHAILI